MNQPVTYVELHTADLPATSGFFDRVFGWEAQPFAHPGYLVAPATGGRGVDAGMLRSSDGQPRVVPVIAVPSLTVAMKSVEDNGGTIVVDPFVVPGVGRGCYGTDPSGLLFGLHENDVNA